MKIKDILSTNKVSFSLEVFPPKAWQSLDETISVIKEMTALAPSFMSVTCRAGSTVDYTVDVASAIEKEGIPALAHLTCYSADKASTDYTLRRLREEKIDNVLALRGDLPADGSPVKTDFAHANDLMAYIKASGDFCIGGACYPDSHPESPSYVSDIEYLKRKEADGADFLTTQMFFDNNIYYAFRYRMLKANVKLPVVAGIMPVTNAKQVLRSAELSGTSLPPRFRAIADHFGDSPAAMKQAGIAFATEQIIDLIANGTSHIHIYTMNKPEVARAIMENLSEIINK